MEDVTVQIDADASFQEIDGFGMNINPVGHWKDGALRPVLDRLVDDYGARLFRLDPYGSMLWLDRDSTGDRRLLTGDRLADAYRSAPFRDAWETARYLNLRGIQPILNLSGMVPRWMCAEDGQTLIDLEGYAELAVSMAHWARVEENIEFTLFGPFNETDLGPPEGPFLAPVPLAEVSRSIAERLAALGMGDVGLVLADEAHYGLDYLQELVRHRAVRDRLAVAGMHSYRDQDLSGVPAFLREHDLTSCRYWLTEYGDLDQTGELEWAVALNSTRRLLRGLNDGVQGAMVWDAYDNWHDHDRAWTIYGLLRTAHGSYTPKKRYFAGKHISRYVPVKSVRVHAACSDPSLAVAAFRTQSEEVTLVVLNESGTARRLTVEMDDRFVGGACRIYVTDPEHSCDQTMMFSLASRVQIPLTATSITTFTSVA